MISSQISFTIVITEEGMMGKYSSDIHKPDTKGLQVLFLTLDIYRQAGGIQQINKLLVLVLGNIMQQFKAKSSLYVYSLHDNLSHNAGSEHFETTVYNAFAGNRLQFILSCKRALPRVEVLILSHINLLPVAVLLFIAKPTLRIILLAHGIEVRSDLSCWKTAFLRKTTEIWAVSAFTAQCLKSKIGKHKKVDVLINALPPDFILPNNFDKPKRLLVKHHLSHDYKVLLTVCRINRYTQDKGIELVLRTIPYLLSIYPKISYLIVGEAEAGEKKRLEDIAIKLNIRPYVTFLNFVQPAALTSYYLLADVFVMPSKREGFGLAFIEAAACGCRIVAGNTDGSTDALFNGQLGTLVDPDDFDALKRAIVSQLRHPRSSVQAKITQDLCRSRFSTQAYQLRVQNLLCAPDALI